MGVCSSPSVLVQKVNAGVSICSEHLIFSYPILWPKGRHPGPKRLFFYKIYKWPLTPPRPVFIKVRTTFFKTIKYYPIKNIFNFLQGLVGFGNLRFAEIKSCPSASPTYGLRKVEISSQNDLAKLLQSGKKHKKKLTFYYFRLTYIHTN